VPFSFKRSEFRFPFQYEPSFNLEKSQEIFSAYALSRVIYIDLWHMYLIDKTKKGCVLLSSDPSEFSLIPSFTHIVVSIDLDIKGSKPSLHAKMSTSELTPQQRETFNKNLTECVNRNTKFIIPVSQRYTHIKIGHQSSLVIDPQVRQIFFYDPDTVYDVKEIQEKIINRISLEIYTNECFKAIHEYAFIMPEITMETCNRSIQEQLKHRGLDKGYCQYHTLLVALTYFINDGYTFQETREKLEELAHTTILAYYFMLLKLQDEFVVWIHDNYAIYYNKSKEQQSHLDSPTEFMKGLREFRELNTDQIHRQMNIVRRFKNFLFKRFSM